MSAESQNAERGERPECQTGFGLGLIRVSRVMVKPVCHSEWLITY